MKPFVIHHYCVSHFYKWLDFFHHFLLPISVPFFQLQIYLHLDGWICEDSKVGSIHSFKQVDNTWFDFTRRWIFKLIVSTTVITSAIPRLCWRLLMKIVRRFKYRYMKIILYINVTSGRFWIRFVFQKVVGDVCFIRIGP